MNQELIAPTILEKCELDDDTASSRSEQCVRDQLVQTARLFTMPLT
jgi:hypothetical protein